MKMASTPEPAEGQDLIEALLDAVWIVDGVSLRILMANGAAGALWGAGAADLVGRAVLEVASTPEDEVFWREVAAGVETGIESEALVRRADGSTAAVLRRVSRLAAETAAPRYLVALSDRGAVVDRERRLELRVAELEATLESIGDGILVTDLRGHIRNFNRRFADLWEVPDDLVVPPAEAAVRDWMRERVVDPARYARRLAAIDDAAMLRTSDVVTLKSGRVVERVTMPQCSRGRAIGRVFVFREIAPAVRPLGPST